MPRYCDEFSCKTSGVSFTLTPISILMTSSITLSDMTTLQTMGSVNWARSSPEWFADLERKPYIRQLKKKERSVKPTLYQSLWHVASNKLFCEILRYFCWSSGLNCMRLPPPPPRKKTPKLCPSLSTSGGNYDLGTDGFIASQHSIRHIAPKIFWKCKLDREYAHLKVSLR